MNKVVNAFLLVMTVTAGSFAYSVHKDNRTLKESIGALHEHQLSLDQALEKAAFINEVYRRASYAVIDPNTEEIIALANEILENELAKPLEADFYSCYDRVVRTTSWGSMGVYGVVEECIGEVKDDDVAKRLFALEAMAARIRRECGRNATNRYEEIEKCALSGKYRFVVGLDGAYFQLVTKGLPAYPTMFTTKGED